MTDYVLGVLFFITAPFVPLLNATFMGVGDLPIYESFLTVLIQALSVVLLVTRIVKTWNKDKDEKET
jgi:membrane protein implicated in regulation of membrane protease activity